MSNKRAPQISTSPSNDRDLCTGDLTKYSVKGSPKSALTAATFGFFIGFAGVALIGPVGVIFKEMMGLSALMLGLLVAAPQLAGSLLRIPFGAWADKVGGKKPILILLLISIVGLGGMSLLLFTLYPSGLTRQTYPLLLFFAVLSGAGVAIFSAGIPQASYWFSQKRQGLALGTYAGVANTAPGFFTLILPFVFVALGLPGSYAAWFLFIAIGTLAYAMIAHDAPYFQFRNSRVPRRESIKLAKQAGEELIPSEQAFGALKKSAKNWRTWALVALYFASFYSALTVWFPSYWSLDHGLDVRSAAVLTAITFSILACLVRVEGGQLSDKYGGENVAFASFLLVVAGALILLIVKSFVLDVTGGVIVGTGMGLSNAAVFKLVPKYIPEDVGGASGWIGGLGALAGFILPPILGYFVDYFGRDGYSLGFVVFVLLGIIALLVTIGLRARPAMEEAEV